MESKQLEEYATREKEKVRSIIKGMEGRPFSMMSFYPELKWVQDGLYAADLPTRLSALDQRLRCVPLYVTLPFYDHLVVPIEPLRDEKTFFEWHGIDVETMLSLIKDRKVAIRLNNPLKAYVNLSYLDPLLETEPPTMARSEAYSTTLVGDGLLRVFRKEGEKLIRSFEGELPSFSVRWHMAHATFIEASVTLYERLITLGYSDRVRELFNQWRDDRKAFTNGLRLYYLTLAAPVFRSLNGVHALPKHTLERYQTDVGELFPVEVGRFLVERLQLVRPRGLEHALDIYPDFKRARKTLFTLDRLLEHPKDQAKVKDAVVKLEEAWREAEEIGLTDERVVRLTKTVGLIGAIISGVASIFISTPGLLAGLGFTVLRSEEVASPLAEFASKLGKQSHIVEIYDFRKDVKKLASMR